MSFFDNLPTDIYLEIFSYLTSKQLQMQSGVSKQFRLMSNHPLFWKRHLINDFNYIIPTPNHVHEKSYYAKLTIGKKYLLTVLCKKHLYDMVTTKIPAQIGSDHVNDAIQTDKALHAIDTSDYENLKLIAEEHGKLDSFNNLITQLSNTFKNLFFLKENSLNQECIELIARASFPSETLTNNEINSLDNLGFHYTTNEERADLATAMLKLLDIIFANSSEYASLLLAKQPTLSKVITRKGSFLYVAIRECHYENAKQLISLGADINSCAYLSSVTIQGKLIVNTSYLPPLQRVAQEASRCINNSPYQAPPKHVKLKDHIQFIHYLLEKGAACHPSFVFSIIAEKKQLNKNHPCYQLLSDAYDAIVATNDANIPKKTNKKCVIS